MYYLSSRYYDPEVGRFINADDPSYLGASGTLLSYNLFSYCEDNPLKYADPDGTFINTIIGGLVGGIIGGISAGINGDNVWAGIGIGAGTGALAGLGADIAIATGGIGAIAIAAIGGAIGSGLNYGATEIVNGRDIDYGTMAIEATIGAAANALTFGVGGGSMQRVSGSILKNMEKNFSKTLTANTTRKVAGKVALKSIKGVAKNISKNIGTEIINSTIIYSSSIVIAKRIENMR